MIVINEFLPNPTGKDVDGEFIELWNNGPEEVNIGGYFLRDNAGKTFYLSGSLSPDGYLSLPRSQTKIAINNSDESLFLYGRDGTLADEVSFLGTAPEGASYAKREKTIFLFTETPTPGEENVFEAVINSNALVASPASGQLAPHALTFFETALLGMMVGTLAAVGALYFMRLLPHAHEVY